MNTVAKTERSAELEMLRKIDCYMEEFYPQSVEAGKLLKAVELSTAQIRGLETLITSTRRFSEILNYIKNQAGKERREEPKWTQVAPVLLGQLGVLESEAHRIGGEDPAKVMEVKLRFARIWAKQIVANYLYQEPPEGVRRSV
jgi:hypothetical protein